MDHVGEGEAEEEENASGEEKDNSSNHQEEDYKGGSFINTFASIPWSEPNNSNQVAPFRIATFTCPSYLLRRLPFFHPGVSLFDHSLENLYILHLLDSVLTSKEPHDMGIIKFKADELVSILIENRLLLEPSHLAYFINCPLHTFNLGDFLSCPMDVIISLKDHKSLKRLILSNYTITTFDAISLLSSLRELVLLNLHNCLHLSNDVMHPIGEMKNLVILVMSGTDISDDGIKILSELKPTNLKHLDLSNNINITDGAIQHLQNIKKLAYLILQNCALDTLKGIDEIKLLEFLNVRGPILTVDAFRRLAKLEKLSELMFSSGNFNVNDALVHLANLRLKLISSIRLELSDIGALFLSSFPITTLNLSLNSNIGDEALQYVGLMTQLEKLMLMGTKVTNKGLMLISGLKCLKCLDLEGCGISDIGINVLRYLPSLEYLDLSRTEISNHAFTGNCFWNCGGLKTLYLSFTKISQEGISQLKVRGLSYLNLYETGITSSFQSINGCPCLKSICYRIPFYGPCA